MLTEWTTYDSENYKADFFIILSIGHDLYYYNQLLNEKENEEKTWEDRGIKDLFWTIMAKWYYNTYHFSYSIFFEDPELANKFNNFYDKINNFIESDQDYTGDEIWKEIETLIF